MKLIYSISFFIFCLFNFQVSNAQTDSLEQNLTKINVDNEQAIQIDNAAVILDSLGIIINNKLQNYKQEDLDVHTANIEVSTNTTNEFIEKIKAEIQKTPIQFINVQRSVITNFSESGPVTQEMIEQYNTLIDGWENLDEDERYFRKIELNYVENIHQRMTFQQQVKAKKLPGYLYFVKKPELKTEINFQDLERWRFSSDYLVYINNMQIEKGILSAKDPKKLKGYYILKYLVNEEPTHEVYLFTK